MTPQIALQYVFVFLTFVGGLCAIAALSGLFIVYLGKRIDKVKK